MAALVEQISAERLVDELDISRLTDAQLAGCGEQQDRCIRLIGAICNRRAADILHAIRYPRELSPAPFPMALDLAAWLVEGGLAGGISDERLIARVIVSEAEAFVAGKRGSPAGG